MFESNPIVGERITFIPLKNEDGGIRFNNNITKRYIRNIVKNECILFVHSRYADEALKICRKIKNYRIKGALSRVCIWCTGETQKQFEQRIVKAIKHG